MPLALQIAFSVAIFFGFCLTLVLVRMFVVSNCPTDIDAPCNDKPGYRDKGKFMTSDPAGCWRLERVKPLAFWRLRDHDYIMIPKTWKPTLVTIAAIKVHRWCRS
jgi:hypothetical protein